MYSGEVFHRIICLSIISAHASRLVSSAGTKVWWCSLTRVVHNLLPHAPVSSYVTMSFPFPRLSNSKDAFWIIRDAMQWITTTTNVLQPFFWDHLGEPVPEENFWTLWCKGRLTEADTPTIWRVATPSGLTSAHLYHPPIFFTGQMPFVPPNQQRQTTEGKTLCNETLYYYGCRIK